MLEVILKESFREAQEPVVKMKVYGVRNNDRQQTEFLFFQEERGSWEWVNSFKYEPSSSVTPLAALITKYEEMWEESQSRMLKFKERKAVATTPEEYKQNEFLQAEEMEKQRYIQLFLMDLQKSNELNVKTNTTT